ncbi:MAG: ParD-like family protein [bacterium]|nr:ParD-like family protein [bacterium]
MASKPVKISEEFVAVAQTESVVMNRSIGGQVEYWAKLGRQVERSGVIRTDVIRALMTGEGSVQTLTAAEDEAYLDALSTRLEALDGSDTRILDDLRSRGRSIVSTDDDGTLEVEKS